MREGIFKLKCSSNYGMHVAYLKKPKKTLRLRAYGTGLKYRASLCVTCNIQQMTI